MSIKPDDVDAKVIRALVALDWKADTGPLHRTIEEIRATRPEQLKEVADTWFSCAIAERDAPAAQAAVAALGDNFLANDAVHLRRHFCEGLIARMQKNDAAARAAFTLAREDQLKRVQEQPDYGPGICVLALIDAALGRKEEALAEGRRAIDLMPVAKDAINGAHMITYFAITAAWAGEKDFALEQLRQAIPLRDYAPATYGQLKLTPYWDPLRGDPRFEKIVESLAPK